MRRYYLPSLYVVLWCMIAWFSSQPAEAADAAAGAISRCGKPDVDDSTANDRPRPQIVTRWMEYRKAGVRLMFIPEGTAGAAPPYTGWTLVGTVDTRTRQSIPAKEALDRIGCIR